MKRSWDKPELIVLVRRKSDEVILANCQLSSGRPDAAFMICWKLRFIDCDYQCN